MKKHVLRGVLLGTVRRNVLLVLALLAAIVGTIGFGLLPPLVLERIINRLTGGVPVLFSLALLYFLMLALSGLSECAKEALITAFGQKITHSVRREMCAKLSRLPASFFTANDPGAIAARFVNDVDTVDALFASGIVSMLVDLCKMISIIAVVFYKSRGLGLLLLLTAPVFLAFTRWVQQQMLKAQMKNRAAVAATNNHVPETVRNIRMIHSLHKEKFMEEKYDTQLKECYQAIEKNNYYDAFYSPVILIVSAVIVALMMTLAATGGAMQQFFGMSVGTAVAVIAYVGKVFEPLENIGMEIQSVQAAVAGVKRVMAFLREPEREATDSALTATHLQQSDAPAVAFDAVTFGYTPQQTVLQDLTFTVERGEHVTFAGRTGAGKSTVFKLVLGLYGPQNGAVRVLGAPADAIPDAEKRRIFGYVEQRFRPVPGTVADQIAVFDDTLPPSAVEQAARLVGLHDWITALPQGYQTPYADALFSQGQRQLLSIARAVAAQPPILLLDEIAANLDVETERRVLEVLEQTAEGRTVLSISHRTPRASAQAVRSIPIGGDGTGK